ncbi:MAG: hypothetical protein HY332_06205 [Chloroflexi bacterium]|nr:hypothetical protein [Chloroflexota bacterium]
MAAATTPPTCLYVVDPAGGDAASRVLVLDLITGTVFHTIGTAYNPQIAISPDGRRLYIGETETDGRTSSDWLRVVDTATWAQVAKVPAPSRLLYKIWGTPSMALSPDGTRLHVQKYGARGTGQLGPGNVFYWLDVFDTAANVFLPQQIALPGCGYGLPLPTSGPLAVLCYGTNDLRLAQPATGRVVAQVAIPGAQPVIRPGWVAGAAAGAGRLYAVTDNGQVLMVDPVRGARTAGIDLGMPRSQMVPLGRVALAPDGRHLYVGVGTVEERSHGMASEIWEIDTRKWQRTRVLRPTAPIFQFSIGQDGQQLFAASPWQGSVHIVDLASGQETDSFRDLGGTPAWAVPGL